LPIIVGELDEQRPVETELLAQELAVSPASLETGSAGMTREMKNTTATRPASVGTSHAMR
jgi:hypothetical protein